MQKKISNLPFQGTPEQEKKLHEVIEKHKDDKGVIMPVLQEAQEIYGYLPVEVQTMVAKASTSRWRKSLAWRPSIRSSRSPQRGDIISLSAWGRPVM